MDSAQLNVSDQLVQLKKARTLCLQDDVYWPRIFEGVLPIVLSPIPELRRWGSEFLAESLSTPVLDDARKTKMAIQALDILVELINAKEAESLKYAVQSSASIYPLIFRYICANPKEIVLWQKMGIIKQRILWLWDSGPPGVKVCCIKFVQRVIHIQTPGVSDPRLASKAEISLAAVPTNHPLLPISDLEAEAQGLLDRLLGVFHEDTVDPLLMTSTLNCLPVLIKTRSSISTKILNAVLSFNPLSAAIKNPTQRLKLMGKCIEKTVRVLLLNLMRTNQNGPFVQRMSQYLHRMNQTKSELFDDSSRKRPAIAPPVTQTQESAKRQKFDAAAAPPTPVPFTGPPTYANLYTLTRDTALREFNAQDLPLDIVLQITLATFYSVEQKALDTAIQTVRDRYYSLSSRPITPQPPPAAQTVAAPQPAQQLTALQSKQPAPTWPEISTTPPGSPPKQELVAVSTTEVKSKDEDIEEDEEMEDDYQVGTYRLPLPPYPRDEERIEAARQNVDRMFNVLDYLDKTPLVARKNRGGLMRVAASAWDREGWITLIVRLATRGLGACDVEVKGADGRIQKVPSPVAQHVRERLLAYVLADFKQNCDCAVAWLFEEWYNDQVMKMMPEGEDRVPQYPIWLMKVVDGILPFVEAKDRLIVRFLGEVPELNREIINKVKVLCLDPDRSPVGIQILLYNVLFRPPVKEMCLDMFEDLYRNHKELESATLKYIRKWRPLALEQSPVPPKKEEQSVTNGTNPEPASENSATTFTQKVTAIVDGTIS